MMTVERAASWVVIGWAVVTFAQWLLGLRRPDGCCAGCAAPPSTELTHGFSAGCGAGGTGSGISPTIGPGKVGFS